MLEKLVAFCLRWPWTVVLLTLALTAGGVYLTVERFAIDTDTAESVLAQTSPGARTRWRSISAFPQLDDIIVVVIDAPNGEAGRRRRGDGLPPS